MDRTRFIFCITVICFVIGCDDPTQGLVSGTVTVDGDLAESGSISFTPIDGQASTAGAVIENGLYQATVPVGNARIEIRVPKVVGETKIYDTPDSPIQKVMAESLPSKFNNESELTFEVVAGKSTKDYELTTQSK